MLYAFLPVESAPGFTKVRICPQFIRALGFVRGYLDTVKGRIEAEWKATDGGFTYTVTLPEGIHATYMDRTLNVGKNVFLIKPIEMNS